MTDDTTARSDRSLPIRTLGAALLFAAAGWAFAELLIAVFAAIAVPSFSRVRLPARFHYGIPDYWMPSAGLPMLVLVVCTLAFPLLLNRTWEIGRASCR